jgi:hypothetical protein
LSIPEEGGGCPVAAQGAKLSVGQTSLGTFHVSTVPEPHKFDLRTDARRRTNGCNSVAEIIFFPWQVLFLAPVRLVASDD